MWLLGFVLCLPLIGADFNSNYYCRDLHPQVLIDIAQLGGLWFGIEVINHDQEWSEERKVQTCPIIYIKQEEDPLTTINPIYKNYDYQHNYGQGYGYDTNDQTQRSYEKYETTNHPLTQQEKLKKMRERYEYDQKTTYGNYQNSRIARLGYAAPIPYYQTRYLTLTWDEGSSSKGFHVTYNTSVPGFWKSSGPEFGGIPLDERFNHFVGTIQVIKVVGDHLVLTFCHQLPKKELYTVLLSRAVGLPEEEVHAVRSQLHRKGLSIHSIRKLCSGSSQTGFSLVVLGLSVICQLFTL